MFKPIYFVSIDNSAYVVRMARHSARRSWICLDGENFARRYADRADRRHADLQQYEMPSR
jgi:arylsulfatase